MSEDDGLVIRDGDVVELTITSGAYSADITTVITGSAVRDRFGSYSVGPYCLTGDNGYVYPRKSRTVRVISRAKPPLYVNHPRTEPVRGDVADRPQHLTNVGPWFYVKPFADSSSTGWWSPVGKTDSGIPVGQMRLLVDGETGEVLPR